MVKDNTADGHVLIRARVREDLDALRKTYLTTLSPTTHRPDRDYPYRARATHDELAVAMARIAHDVLYTNFKGEVARVQGWPRERLYSKVWGVMHDAERKLARDRIFDEDDVGGRGFLTRDESDAKMSGNLFGVTIEEQAAKLFDSIDGVPKGRLGVLGGKTKKAKKKK